MDRRFLLGILNSEVAHEQLQVLAYRLLNTTGYQPTDGEIAALIAARLNPEFKRSSPDQDDAPMIDSSTDA